ncbi:FKBP-type peptidyl-prolyl cis-trans isomerase [Halomonas sp. WWR20]
MPIAPQQVVTLHYTLQNASGTLLDDSRQRDKPLEYLHGHDNIVAGLEQALQDHDVGDTLRVTLAPEQAYGRRDEALIQQIARSAFPGGDDVLPGRRFQAQGPDGPRVVTVLEVSTQHVVVDANHPLAGETLSYELEVLALRKATRAELAKGHPLAEEIRHTQLEDRKMP